MHIEAIDLTVRSYPTLILIAAVVCIWIGAHWAARLEGLDAGRLLRALLVINVFVFAGARLHFVVTHWSMFRTHPLEILNCGSALLELLRADYQPRTYWGPLPQLEWVALFLTALSLSALLYAERRHGHPRASAGR